MKKIIYGVYDLKNKEQCIGIFNTMKEIGVYFEKNVSSIQSAICRHNKINARYIIVKLINEMEDDDDTDDR